MPRALPRDRWLAESAERFAALDAWRQAHPTATWAEIEAAVDAQLGPLRAHLLGDTAMASDAADLGGERRVGPECGERLQAAGAPVTRRPGRGDRPGAVVRSVPGLRDRAFPPWMRNWSCSPGRSRPRCKRT